MTVDRDNKLWCKLTSLRNQNNFTVFKQKKSTLAHYTKPIIRHELLIRVNTTSSLPILPKIIPFSVEATFTLALMLQKSFGAMVTG